SRSGRKQPPPCARLWSRTLRDLVPREHPAGTSTVSQSARNVRTRLARMMLLSGYPLDFQRESTEPVHSRIESGEMPASNSSGPASDRSGECPRATQVRDGRPQPVLEADGRLVAEALAGARGIRHRVPDVALAWAEVHR